MLLRNSDSEINHVLKLSEEANIMSIYSGVSVSLFDTMPRIYFEETDCSICYAHIQMRPGAASYVGAVTRKSPNHLWSIG